VRIRKIPLAAAGIAFAIMALAVMLHAGGPAPEARAWTSSNYAYIVHSGGDKFVNYDNTGNPGYSTTVDWPVRFLFRENAEIDKVKNRLDGCGSDPAYASDQICSSGGAMHHRADDGSGEFYDQDSGKKRGSNCNSSNWDQHMRFYANPANDWNYNVDWGFWMVSSNHRDYEWTGGITFCSSSYQSVESDETFWNSRVITFNGLQSPSWSINTNTLSMVNAETARWADSNHYVESNGYGSIIWVP